MHIYIYAYIFICIYACINTYIYTYIYIRERDIKIVFSEQVETCFSDLGAPAGTLGDLGSHF